MDVQHFERITAFIEARLTPLFDAETGSEYGFGMDDTSRALRALRNAVLEASAVKGLIGKRESQDAATRRVIDQSVEHHWDVLRGIARQWEDHADFRREFKRHAWELDAAPAPAAAQG
ncbi:hypothetical protein AB0P12_10040 [Streptomyces subrutilus]|uniref:Uncharacterized protein n=1 Tax=Streptomyces subrutilus TaxID=36818 RepID=A0A5P2UDN6_9ACTN|nr:hypothetical protein [Streptomyces subrutilus]QEU77396.1 hypothetical protein CP968_03030 [Streptomyces subrutilus]WSJ33524.1 hypothetical protein OG479_31795 [Streptomyces subrutilus]GGZ47117.1 hypothetical protein GCM10010371_02960 [Streptomyces subrutilus]